MFTAFLIFLFALYGLIAWKDLKFALVLLAGLLPLYLLRFSVGPIPSTGLEELILIAAGVWIVKHHGWRIDYRSVGPYVRPLLLLLAAASFAVVVAQDTFGALGLWKAYFVEPALVFLMLRSQLTKKEDWIAALKALGVSAVALSLFAIFQAVTGIAIPEPWDIERRATGLFDFPNALGLFLAPILAMSVVLAVKTKERLFWIFVSVFSLVGIVLAETEAALGAVPLALVITLLFSDAPKRIKTRISVEFAIFAALIVGIFDSVRAKILFQDLSGQVRLSQWHETLTLLKSHLAFGTGLGGYPTALAPIHDPTLYEIFQYPHNIFLNIWVELGLLGLLAFFWLAWRTLKTIRIEKAHPLKLAAFAALLTMTIHGLVDVPYFKNDLSVMVWILLAIMSAAIPFSVDKRKKKA